MEICLEQDQTAEDLESVSKALKRAAEIQMEVEVVYFALCAMRANPGKSIECCLDAALAEWDK